MTCLLQGRRLMRLWFLRPLVNLEVLSDRHDTIELLMPAPELMKTLRDVMAKVRDVPKLLAKLQLMQGRPELATFRQLQDSLSHLLVLRDMFSSLAPRVAEQSEDGAAQGASASMVGGQGWSCLTRLVAMHRCPSSTPLCS